jgi:queuine tRNA-ribosyltransferase
VTSECFTIKSKDGLARTGLVHTNHGEFQTPAFMPVGTQAAVKSLTPDDVLLLGAEIVLSNTYHLYLRPGVDLIREFGGLHSFMSWERPILTDSGGFQGYSLSALRKVTKDGILFKSHLDGSLHNFTPENVISYQESLGSDIIMPIDVCEFLSADKQAAQESLELTNSWALRSINAQTKKSEQLLFGIVQGGMFKHLREQSVDFLTSLGFPGYAIGGLSVGESKEQLYSLTAYIVERLPQHSPRYLMGVGSPEDLVESVASGVDMFDCVLPTRIARNGAFFSLNGRKNIFNSKFKSVDAPIEENCDCYTCQTFSASYVHHLFKSKELLAYRLGSIHNLRFLVRLMEQIRDSIEIGKFQTFRKEFHERFIPPNEQIRREQKIKWEKSRVLR